MKCLVVGGAGYIGGHFVNQAHKKHKVIVVDNFSQGKNNCLRGVQYWNVDIRDKKSLLNVFQMVKPDIVDHFAALSHIPQAVKNPADLYETNIIGSLNILECMRAVECKKIIFMSSAAIYADSDKLITENSLKGSNNPYGKSKWMFEQILQDYYKAYGISSVSFRPFCVAGIDPKLEVGCYHNPHWQLFPNLIKSFLGGQFEIHGDGGAIRDLIDVNDIVDAHLLAIQKLDKPICEAYNLSNGKGYAIMQVIKKAEKIIGHKGNYVFNTERKANPFKVVGDSSKAQRELKWKPMRGIDDIIKTGYKFFKSL